MRTRLPLLWVPLAAAFFSFTSAASAVTIDWVTVGDPGNPGDWYGRGAVNYVYRISKYEVTNAQYAEFLKAVAVADTHDLYNTAMGSVMDNGGITRSGGDLPPLTRPG
jgi:formylglycine-generating enzyme required for sulfatase activity